MDKSILTDLQIDKVIAFNQDEQLVDALKKIFLAVVYENGTLKSGVKANPLRNGLLGLVSQTQNGVISNEDLGADLRAVFEAIKMIEMGFTQAAKIKGKSEEVVPDGGLKIAE